MARKPMPDNLNKNPNILDELQNIEIKKPISEKKEEREDNDASSSSLEHPIVNKRQDPVPISRPAEIATITTKSKVNLYLNDLTKRRLEKSQPEIRGIVPRELSSKINQSTIVDVAVNIILDEYDRTGRNSALIKELERQLRSN